MSFLKQIIFILVFIVGVLIGGWICAASHKTPQERLAEIEQNEKTPRNLLVGFATLEGHPNKVCGLSAVTSLAFSPSGEFLLSGGSDSTVRLWNWVTGEEIKRFQCEEEGVLSAVWSPSGEEFAVAGYSGTVSLWNVKDGSMKWRSQKREGAIRSVLFDPSGEEIYAGGDDARVVALDAATGEERRAMATDLGIQAMAIKEDVLMAGTKMDDKYRNDNLDLARVLSWEGKSGRRLGETAFCGGGINGIVFYSDQDVIIANVQGLVGSNNIELTSEGLVAYLGKYGITSPGTICMIPKSSYMLVGTSGSRENMDTSDPLRGRLILLNTEKHQEILDQAGVDSIATSSIAVSPDGKIIAAGGAMDGHIVLFRTPEVCFEEIQ